MVEKFNIETKKHPCILLAALDWGLGHATRCVPIVRYLLQSGCEVIIAAEGKQLTLLQLEFPSLQFVHLRGYHFKYSNNRWKTIVKITAQIPGLFWSVFQEHQWLKAFVKQKRIDAVISDNRYGFYLRSVPSVFITHQLHIQTPLGNSINRLVNFFNHRAIRAFDSCWVPDLAGNDNFGGKLCHPGLDPARLVSYIGALTRFTIPVVDSQHGLLLALVSGPEPQRTIFENEIIRQARKLSSLRLILIRGLPGNTDLPAVPDNVTVQNHLETKELAELIASAEYIISRSGYSTVMEMISAGKKCLFIPTPGQSEQEYLADYLSEKGFCLTATQNDFSLADMLLIAKRKQWRTFKPSSGLMEKTIDMFISRLRDSDRRDN